MFSELDSYLDSFLLKGTPGYDCIVYHKGEPIYRRFAGFSDYENGIPMKGNELFNMYSCSKIMTVTAAMMLWEEGEFRLSDKLSDYLPEFSEMLVNDNGTVRRAERPILVEDLFTMTAGFDYEHDAEEYKDFARETKGVCKTSDFPKYIARRPLLFEPGKEWNYSFCHDVLAAFIERITGERFGSFVKRRIFDPCKMTHSTFWLDPSRLEEVSAQYRFDESGVRRRISKQIIFYKFGTEFESGGAGCISTAEDCLRFLEALRKGELIKPKTIDLMTYDRIEHRRGSMWIQDYGYGLGLKCARPGIPTAIYGWGGAAGADMVIDKAHDITLVYTQHVLRSPVAPLKTKLIFLVQKLLGYKPDGVVCRPAVPNKNAVDKAKSFGQ